MHRRVSVAGDVLNAGPQLVRVPNTRHCVVVADPEQDLSAQRVCQRGELTGEGGGETLLILQHGSLTFLEQDIELRRIHGAVLLLDWRDIFSLGPTAGPGSGSDADDS